MSVTITVRTGTHHLYVDISPQFRHRRPQVVRRRTGRPDGLSSFSHTKEYGASIPRCRWLSFWSEVTEGRNESSWNLLRSAISKPPDSPRLTFSSSNSFNRRARSTVKPPYPTVVRPLYHLRLQSDREARDLYQHIIVGFSSDCYRHGQDRPQNQEITDLATKDAKYPPGANMRSELILTAMAHTNCQCRQTMQRLRADSDPIGPAMEIPAATPEKKMGSLRCGLGPRGSYSRHANAYPQVRLQAGISCTCSKGNEGGLNVTGNLPSMQHGNARPL
jgi:hypothetical protein